LYTSILKIIAL